MATIGNTRQRHPAHCNIIIEGGRQWVVMPSGEKIPAQVWTRVYDPLDKGERPHVIVKLYVNLGDQESGVLGSGPVTKF